MPATYHVIAGRGTVGGHTLSIATITQAGPTAPPGRVIINDEPARIDCLFITGSDTHLVFGAAQGEVSSRFWFFTIAIRFGVPDALAVRTSGDGLGPCGGRNDDLRSVALGGDFQVVPIL